MNRLRSWHSHLSADRRCDALQYARRSAYDYATAAEGRGKRWVTDVMDIRRMAQDHRLGRYLDAAFERATAPRGTMALPSATPWKDRAALAACLVGTAVRQVIDVLACVVGAVVGLARLPLALPSWGRVQVDADPEVLRKSFVARLGGAIERQLEQHPLKDDELSYQWTIDQGRQDTVIEFASDLEPWEREGPIDDKVASLVRCCDNDFAWAQSVSLVLNQLPAQSFVEALATDGRMRLGNRDIGLWTHRSNPEARGGSVYTQVLRYNDDVVVYTAFGQQLNSLLVGQRDGAGAFQPDDASHLHCDGFLNYQFFIKVPRPLAGTTPGEADFMVPRWLDSRHYIHSTQFMPPPPEAADA